MISARTARWPARGRGRCSSTCRRSRPATARSLAERLSAEGHAFVDAPVTGSSPKAEAGTLTIMVRRRGGRRRARAAAVRGDGREDRPRRRGGPGPGRQGALAGRDGGQLRDARPGDHGRAPDRARPRRAAGGDDGRLVGLDDARAQGPADGRARLPRAVQARAHAQGRRSCAWRSRAAPGASFPFAGLAGELYSAGVGRGLGQQDFAAVLEVVEGLTGNDSS